MNEISSEAAVIFAELPAGEGKRIGHATLNKPKALNALNLDMIRLLQPQLEAWKADEGIVAVVLDGSGDKAFCAGGDVVAMHQAMKASPGKVPAMLETFFTEEYRLDHFIHTFGKPFVVWGNGIVMGGGLGLMNGASHRIVTATSRIAMPEISIGLYPDVGGSWFLNRMPGGAGLFLGLTGASINAADALYIKLADYFINHELKADFLAQLQQLKWGNTQSLNNEKLSQLCLQFQRDSQLQVPSGNVKAHQSLINKLTAHNSAAEVVNAILTHDPGEDKWLSKAIDNLRRGSPLTAAIVFRQLQEGKQRNLEDCFRMELGLSCRCGETGEFQEGVRALLIDKDNQPTWLYQNVEEIPQKEIDRFFTSPWKAEAHPLASLDE
ncbi:enoyl-CoA hydratase/isomerase family protein [Aliiglaciecola sp. CAU 1673]|uniref:enoyl-CoA hydratase/isomerase family protein n=1 Tax=Aliiglaciecola sp. CAU 1673 TaxID=3032595 RepID=UPI0023DB2702|nr:enoyl-CoA hydratase/isomerase family protein [Aliiglaciecola sp. CAU 1673]MDF2177698.1 enoyl-CoA hydratase/isomerase family protein [Aliiglaciecola sp. CAU 1673]